MRVVILAVISVLLVFTYGCDSKKEPMKNKQTTASSTTPTKTADVTKQNELPNVSVSFTKESFPKIDGSTATIPLTQAMAGKLLGMSSDESEKFIKHNTTHNAYVNLIEGKADIIFVTEPSDEELKIAKDANVEIEVVPVVKEGFVFLVNMNNPVSSLTVKQIQDIYQGKINSWSEVGGNDSTIIPYQREKNSGSQTIMEQSVMKGIKMMDAPKNIVWGMSELIDSIAKYDNAENALGYSVYYYAKSMYNKDTIKFIAVDGIAPDNNTIASGKYPFTSAYYAVFKKSEAQTSPARSLLAWIMSREGQETAEKAGYVPLEVR
ncbi:MAG TPA: substrate-binding domain-containing protein [Pseudobacteroides sp.]|uniref:PstS family phosphate ABC transporter substrate-binding protein n=1 Tax=Pseudobacteroides sp. TaxID=1968840 RepID=UPI002F9348BF